MIMIALSMFLLAWQVSRSITALENTTIQHESALSKENPIHTEEIEVPALPPPSTDPGNPLRTLSLGGDPLKLDDLGPIIINPDGTTRRIANWQTLTKQEQESSWRIISARNKKRISELQKSENR